jgi:hypothetical protein
MMDVRKVGSWDRVRNLLASAPKRIRDAREKVLVQEAEFFRTKVVEGIREQAPGGVAFKPLAPTTIAIRRFGGFSETQALLGLADSITVAREGDQLFVGVPRSARSRSGKPLAEVARVLEAGSPPIVVKLTPRARRFLHLAFRKAGLDTRRPGQSSTGIVIVRIPARPFLGPVFEKHAGPDQAARRLLDRVSKDLGADFGR